MTKAEEAYAKGLNCDGIRVGALEIRQGVLYSRDGLGRSYYRAPRRADVALAQRVVAAVAASDEGPLLATDIVGLREK